MNAVLVGHELPVGPLLKRVREHPEWWAEETMRQDFLGSAHYATQTIYLRGPLGFTYEEYFEDVTAVDYPRLADVLDALMPVLRPVLKNIEWTELGRMMLVRLPAGASLDEHVDQGAYAKHYARFHVPLATNRKAELVVAGQPLHLERGSAWWFDHRSPHYARNAGRRERIHFIFDAVSPLFPCE